MVPETAALKSTRPQGSGDLEQISTGHTYSGSGVELALSLVAHDRSARAHDSGGQGGAVSLDHRGYPPARPLFKVDGDGELKRGPYLAAGRLLPGDRRTLTKLRSQVLQHRARGSAAP